MALEITQEQMMEVLDTCYKKAIDGIPGSLDCTSLASEYKERYGDIQIAANKLIDNQILKCTTSGFVTGLGGLITLPIALPANVISVLYVQLRMIASVASIAGYDVHSDEVQTLAYLCLVRSSIVDVCKSAGVKIANKATLSLLKKLPGTVLTKINQKVGFRLLTKFGAKGVVNLGKLVPVVGGVIGGGIDYVDTKAIGKQAFNAFILNSID